MIIKTQYDVDSKVHVIYDSKIVETFVQSIDIDVNMYRMRCKYKSKGFNWTYEDKALFDTKQDAAMQMLRDNGIDVGLVL